MERPLQQQHHFRISPAASVRTRLTLWYLAMMAFIVCLFGGSLYVSQAFLNADATEIGVEAQLYQDSQRFADIYKQALLTRQVPTTLRLTVPSHEMLLLLRPDGSMLDSRGPLTSNLIQQLQARAGPSLGMIDLIVPSNNSHSWWTTDDSYRVLIEPVLNQNSRVAILLVGLPHPHSIPLLVIWFFHGMLALLV
ncbi:MAG TPA: hypothetical protein VKR42_03980, partial [Ktedonobacteraceae bacterium]|nr:hypothetical protein [Ktedonobacteraceae bacterium]